jgi:uncharacterized protein (DUF427 family)
MKHIRRIDPKPGQESVWDYPRPPRLEPTDEHVVVVFNGVTIADTRRAFRVLETSHPPNYYIPAEDVMMDRLVPNNKTSYCEWKGQARYFDVVDGSRRAESAAWYYEDPTNGFVSLRNYVAFYAGRVEACYVNGERATPQPGGFYGGWITSRVVGPFKGVPGSSFW